MRSSSQERTRSEAGGDKDTEENLIMEDDADKNLRVNDPEYIKGKEHLISICGAAKGFSSSPSHIRKGISRLPDKIRKVNAKAYKPVMLALGPYSARDTPTLLQTEEIKKGILKEFFESDEHKAVKYWKFMKHNEERLRSFYEDESISNEVNGTNFLDMMILDCFFIFELVSNRSPLSWNQLDSTIAHDMLLYENQVPFIILDYLPRLTTFSYEFTSYVIRFLHFKVGYDMDYSSMGRVKAYHYSHLLSLFYEFCCPQYEFAKKRLTSRSLFYYDFPSATELKESFGVNFTKSGNKNLFNLSFWKGRFRIPCISLNDKTEAILRNLMAYEEMAPSITTHYVTDYIILMNSLINSTRDVELFCGQGIIRGITKDEKEILQFFRNIQPQGFHVSMYESAYIPLFKGLRKFCHRKRNRLTECWKSSMVVLRRDYCNSPWAFVSFLAACILLVLTFIQTIYTAYSNYND